MIDCESVGCCPLEFGLCACDLISVADAFYQDGDPRRRRFTGDQAEAVRMGMVRSRLRGLADQIGGHDLDDHAADEHVQVEPDSGLRCGACAAPIR